MITSFRVHYSLTSLDGVERHHRDIAASTPDEAVAKLAALLKPKQPSIGKVKRLKGEMA